MTYEVPVTRARAEFADLVNRVVYGSERVVLTRHGKPIAAIVSAADLGRLEQSTVEEPARIIRLTSDHRAGVSGHPMGAAAASVETLPDSGGGHERPGSRDAQRRPEANH